MEHADTVWRPNADIFNVKGGDVIATLQFLGIKQCVQYASMPSKIPPLDLVLSNLNPSTSFTRPLYLKIYSDIDPHISAFLFQGKVSGISGFLVSYSSLFISCSPLSPQFSFHAGISVTNLLCAYTLKKWQLLSRSVNSEPFIEPEVSFQCQKDSCPSPI
jgi:hypothetical protein